MNHGLRFEYKLNLFGYNIETFGGSYIFVIQMIKLFFQEIFRGKNGILIVKK